MDQASNTLLPRARAKFSLRLAPGQVPAEAMDAVRRHVVISIQKGVWSLGRGGRVRTRARLSGDAGFRARIARGAVLSVRNEEFVLAARALGAEDQLELSFSAH